MRLDGIQMEQFLSFERFEWTALDPYLNVIVGPNGAGKTNLFHALRAVVYAVSAVRQSDLPWEQGVRRGPPGRLMKICLDLSFTEQRERDLICAFFGAALWEVLKNQPYYSSVNLQPELSTFLHQQLQPKDIEWLFTGRLVVTYDEAGNHWNAWYESRPEAPSFRWTLQGYNQPSFLIGETVLVLLMQQLTQAWKETFAKDPPSNEVIALHEADVSDQLPPAAEAIEEAPVPDDVPFGGGLLDGAPPTLEPIQLETESREEALAPNDSLADVLSTGEQSVQEHSQSEAAPTAETSAPEAGEPDTPAIEEQIGQEQAQRAMEPLQETPPPDDVQPGTPPIEEAPLPEQPQPKPQPAPPPAPPLFDAERALIATPLGKGFSLRFGSSQSLSLATHQAFEQAFGGRWDQNMSFEASFLFEQLLKLSLVFTDNIRRLPGYTYSIEDMNRRSISLNNGEHLALHLLRKKVGPDQRDRDQYQAIRDTFFTLTKQQFEVVWASFDRAIARGGANTPRGDERLRLAISLTGAQRDIPLEFSGAGLFEALFLSSLLASGEGQVVLLDEPALNLHPTLQTTLLQLLQKPTGNQFLLTTHSPALVPPNRIEHISRFLVRQGATTRAALDLHHLDQRDQVRLKQELRGSSDARALLFMQGVILVEGGTEVGALPIWIEKRFPQTLESKNIVLYSVGTDTSFKTLVRYLQEFEVPWAILCDGPVIGDQRPSRIVTQLQEADIEHLPDPNEPDFLRLCQALEPCGVFTLAQTPHDEFEHLPIIQHYWDEARREYGRSKIRIGWYVADRTDCPEEAADLLQRILDYLDRERY